MTEETNPSRPANFEDRCRLYLDVAFILLSFILFSIGCSRQVGAAPGRTAAPTVELTLSTLKDETPTAEIEAAPAHTEATADPVELLIADLKSYDSDARERAASSLGQIKDLRAVEPLIAALDEDFQYVLDSVEGALINIGDPAIEPLIAALQDENLNIRANAATLLGQIKDPRAIEPLIATLRDEKMQYCVSYALAQIGAPAVEPLIAALKDGDAMTRSSAAVSLGQMNDSRAVVPLIAALEDNDFGVQLSALVALGQIKDTRALRAVFSALKDESLWRTANDILVQVNEAYAIDASIDALKDENEQVRGSAYVVLSQIGAPALEPLITALNDENSNVRASAALLLGTLGDPQAIEPLLAVVFDESLDVRRAALVSLLEFEDSRADEPFMTALKNEDLEFIAESYELFIRKGVEDSEAILIEALDQYGSKKMAEDFLNCGNSLLVDAATKWAQIHGYTITQVPGSGGPGWGFGP